MPVYLLVALSLITYATAATKVYNLEVTLGSWAADCVLKEGVYLVNGQFPGPDVSATEGDTVIVNVKNSLPQEELAIHWHGIPQVGTPYNDGVPGVSQCPIGHGEVYSYKFTAPKAGTFSYYGHMGLQRAGGLYGKLIVHGKQFPCAYDGEISILLSDWWHKTSEQMAAGLDRIPFTWPGDPASLLIDGHGKYDCSKICSSDPDESACDPKQTQCAPMVYYVKPGKTYRVRLVSVTSVAQLNVVFEDHVMEVMMADGQPLNPFNVTNLDIWSGQTVDFVIRTSQAVSNYWITVSTRGRQQKTPQALAVLSYAGAGSGLPSTTPPQGPAWDDFLATLSQYELYRSNISGITVPQQANRTLLLTATQNNINGKIRWAMNNISAIVNPTPLLQSAQLPLSTVNQLGLYNSQPAPDNPAYIWNYSLPEPYPSAVYSSQLYTFTPGEVIDLVIQVPNTLTPGQSFFMPFHIHGHNFWELGSFSGPFDPGFDIPHYNLVNPVYRNTQALFPGGWTTLRFIASNVGVWMLECETLFFQYLGLSMTFNVPGPVTFPPHTKKCGLLI